MFWVWVPLGTANFIEWFTVEWLLTFWQWCSIVICCPLIRPDCCTWLNMILNDRQQCLCIPPSYSFHVTKSWFLWCMNHSKNPNFISCTCSSAMMILEEIIKGLLIIIFLPDIFSGLSGGPEARWLEMRCKICGYMYSTLELWGIW